MNLKKLTTLIAISAATVASTASPALATTGPVTPMDTIGTTKREPLVAKFKCGPGIGLSCAFLQDLCRKAAGTYTETTAKDGTVSGSCDTGGRP